MPQALTQLLHRLRRLRAPCSDRVLLDRFLRSRDEAAFTALVSRHGPLVLRLCRRWLRQEQDVEDAFQATFLVLARRAGAIRCRDSLAAWLHGVAYRIASRARAADSRQQQREALSPDLAPPDPHPDPLDELTGRELLTVVDEEVQLLPAAYRLPILLCCLEGKSQEEAARLLGWTAGSVKGRLERGRERLRNRLARRGLSLPSALAIASIGQGATSAGVPAALATATLRVEDFASGVSSISDRVRVLAESGIKGMAATKAKLTLGLALLASILIGGAGLAFRARTAATPAQTVRANKAADQGSGRQKSEGEKRPRTDLHGDPLPEGAQARLGTIRFRHDHPYLHLWPALSSDGKVLATGGNNELRLWETATGKLLREIRDGYSYSQPFFAPDGRWLAGHLGERDVRTVLRLWDSQTGRRILDIPTDGQAQACSPDGKQLVTTAADGSISLWDTTTGKRTAHLRGGHKGQATDVAFTADGKGLVTVCLDSRVTDRSICHWDLASGRLEKTIGLKLPRHLHRVCLSPDGKSLAVSPRGGGSVFLLDTSTGTERFKLQGELAQGGYGLNFSPDGKTLATSQADLENWSEETKVAFWDAGTGKLLRHFSMSGRAALHFCFASDGRMVVIAGQEPLLHLWDVATGKPIHNWTAHEGAITELAFTPDGSALVSGSRDGSVRLWDVKSGRHLRELQRHPWGVTGVAVTPDGKTIVSSGTDGCLRLQSLDGRESRRILLGRLSESTVYTLGISPDGKRATTYSSERNAGIFFHVWDLSTGKAIVERRDPSKVIRSHTFSPDAKLMLHYEFGGDAGGAGVAPGGTIVPPVNSTLAVVEDVASGKQVLSLAVPELNDKIGTFSADGRLLLTASLRSELKGDGWHSDNSLLLWELASRKVRQTITWSGQGRFIGAALAPDGSTAATARDDETIRQNDQTIQLWDLTTGKELLSRSGFFSAVWCLAFSADGRLLASGHGDGTILVWDVGVVMGRPDDAETKPDLRRIKAWWSELASEDAGKAYRAVGRLAAAPEPTVDWLRTQLRPTPEVSAAQLRSVLADLDSTDFSHRQAASKRLVSLADRASPALRAALKGDLSIEQRRRIEEALAILPGVPPANALRDLRGVEVLERMGTPAAKQLLRELTRGAPGARLTREAEASLERLARHHP